MAFFFLGYIFFPDIFKFSYYANLATETSSVVQVQWYGVTQN